MANPADDRSPEAEEEGGPVKSFLEHLEDLRWTLVKCVTTVAVGVILCLLAGKYLVAFMVWPLQNVSTLFAPKSNSVPVLLGTNTIGKVDWKELALPLAGTNPVTAVRLVPVPSGTNYVLALQPEIRPQPHSAQSLVVLKNYSPIEGIMVALKLSIYGGLVLTAPLVILFVGQFVLPALKVNEKHVLYQAVGVGAGLFVLGVAFCYLLVSVFALGATVEFSKWLGFTADEWRADAYIGFMSKFMLGMGLAFELPVVLLTLVRIGILEYGQLQRFRAYAVVLNLVISAFVTPSGDPFTMLILAIPLHLLYEISVFIAGHWERKQARAQAGAAS
ncbi:MAG: twin-arginine translocase subunit TatC [Verrucomicrobia bacterium]|jgi:sec-independent protein translocase protein TatC|nr:twin-arginine translocase subunit TatC [Verrucomicrobiota bacterium]